MITLGKSRFRAQKKQYQAHERINNAMNQETCLWQVCMNVKKHKQQMYNFPTLAENLIWKM